MSRHQSIRGKSARAQRHNGQTVGGDHSNGPTPSLIDRLPDTTIPIDQSGRRFSPTRFSLTGATTSSVPTAHAHATRRQAKNALHSGVLLQAEQAQDFLSAHALIHGQFHPRRHLLAADAYRALRSEAFDVWKQEMCARYGSVSDRASRLVAGGKRGYAGPIGG